MNQKDFITSSNNRPLLIEASMTHQALNGFVWIFSSSLLQRFLQLIVLAILARLLLPTAFGVVGMALVLVEFSVVFSEAGLGPAIIQRKELELRHLQTGFTVSLILGIVFTGIIWLIAPSIAAFFETVELASVLRILSLLFLLRGVSVIAESLLQRKFRFRLLSIINVLSYAFGFMSIGVILGYMEYGIWALVWANLAQALIKATILLIVSPHPIRLQIERSALKDLISFGCGVTAMRITNYFARQSDKVIIGSFLGSHALGIYGRSCQLGHLPSNILGQPLYKILFPVLASVKDNHDRLANIYRRCISILSLCTFPACVVFFILAPELIYVLLGPHWNEVIVPFQIIILALPFRILTKINGSLINATGAVYRRLWREMLYALLTVAGACIGLHWGLCGVALGVLFAIIVNFIFLSHLCLKLTGITLQGLFSAQALALPLTSVVCFVTYSITMVFRNSGLTPFQIIFASTLVIFCTVSLLVCRYTQRFFLGQEGLWLLRKFVSYIPQNTIFSKLFSRIT